MRGHSKPRRFSRIFWALLLLAVAVYGGLGLMAIPHPLQPVYSGDQDVFHIVGRAPLASAAFWCGPRPWAVPLLHKLAGLRDQRVVCWQLLLLLAAHGILAGVVFRALGGRVLGLGAALAVLALALSPCIHGWTMVIRSESFAYAVTALTVASTILMLECIGRRQFSRRTLLALMASFFLATVLLVFSRDNWSYQLPLLAALAAAAGWRRHGFARWAGLVLGCGLLALFAVQTTTARVGDRWRPCLMNVLFQRVFPDVPARERWIQDYQMPWDEQLRGLAGQWSFSNQFLGCKHQVFQDWLTRRGLRSYAYDVLTHPAPYADDVWRNFGYLINYIDMKDYMKTAGNGTALTRTLERIVFRPLPPYVAELCLILCMVIPLAVGLLAREAKLTALAWTTFTFALGLPIQMAVCILADALEVMRHAQPVVVMLRLLMILTLFTLLAALGRLAGEIRRQRRRALGRRINDPPPEDDRASR